MSICRSRILTLIEAVVFYGSVYGAVLARFHADYGSIEHFRDLEGPLWMRALIFTVVMITCLLAFGLYSARQRARFAGIVLRLAVALATGMMATSALFYLIPDLWVGRGVMGLAALGGGLCGTAASRFIFTRMVDEDVFKRRVLVYGASEAAAAVAELRRRSDRRGFSLVGFVAVPGERRMVESGRLLQPSNGLLALCNQLDVAGLTLSVGLS